MKDDLEQHGEIEGEEAQGEEQKGLAGKAPFVGNLLHIVQDQSTGAAAQQQGQEHGDPGPACGAGFLAFFHGKPPEWELIGGREKRQSRR